MQDRDSKDLARSLLSIGTRKKLRPKDYITMAKEFEDLRHQISDKEIAHRFGVSSEMIREFRSLLKLPVAVQQLIKDGDITLVKGYQLSRLPRSDEQKTLALSAIEHKMSTPEVREVIKLKRRNPTKPLSQCIEIVLQTRPIIEELHIVGMEIQDTTMHKLRSEAGLSGRKSRDIIKDILYAGIPSLEKVESVVIKGNLALFQIDKNNFQRIREKAAIEQLPIGSLLDPLIINWLTTRDGEK